MVNFRAYPHPCILPHVSPQIPASKFTTSIVVAGGGDNKSRRVAEDICPPLAHLLTHPTLPQALEQIARENPRSGSLLATCATSGGWTLGAVESASWPCQNLLGAYWTGNDVLVSSMKHVTAGDLLYSYWFCASLFMAMGPTEPEKNVVAEDQPGSLLEMPNL